MRYAIFLSMNNLYVVYDMECRCCLWDHRGYIRLKTVKLNETGQSLGSRSSILIPLVHVNLSFYFYLENIDRIVGLNLFLSRI